MIWALKGTWYLEDVGAQPLPCVACEHPSSPSKEEPLRTEGSGQRPVQTPEGWGRVSRAEGFVPAVDNTRHPGSTHTLDVAFSTWRTKVHSALTAAAGASF